MPVLYPLDKSIASCVKLLVSRGVVPIPLLETFLLELTDSLLISELGLFICVIVMNILKSFLVYASESKGLSEEGLLVSSLS